MDMADRSPPPLEGGGTLNIERPTLNVERKRMEEREVRSSQGEMISESPAHVGTMRSDSLHSLSPHGLGGSESTTPWGNEGVFVPVSRWHEISHSKNRFSVLCSAGSRASFQTRSPPFPVASAFPPPVTLERVSKFFSPNESSRKIYLT
jgi:hypothetical protein